MESVSSYDRDEETHNDSPTEMHAPRIPHKGGKHVWEEPTSLSELQACPLAITCFQQQFCFQFCEMVARVQYHHELARLFVLHLHNGQVTLAGVTFTLTPESISLATSIPNFREQWNKKAANWQGTLWAIHQAWFLRQLSRFFPFQYLKNSYAPLMKLIIKYFSYEGLFSHLYSYHIRLLMHFTRVRMMNLPYFMCRNIEKMTTLVQKKTP